MSNIDRNKKIISLFLSGKTMQQIADIYNISRERVRQILDNLHIDRWQGGAHLQSKIKAHERKIKLDNRWLPIYKCTKAERNAINKNKRIDGKSGSLAYAFLGHRRNSFYRGIAFNLSFPEWHKIWTDSGHLSHRGAGIGGYVMSRYKDSGAYEVGNVEIILATKNHSDAWKYKRWIFPRLTDKQREQNKRNSANKYYRNNRDIRCAQARKYCHKKKSLDKLNSMI